jgi:hypothetical protein
LFFKHN